MKQLFGRTSDLKSIIFIRVAVGLIFFTQGTLKYIDPHMGVLRFTRIPVSRLYRALCGLLRSRVRGFDTDWPADSDRQRSAADRHPGCNCDDQDSRVVPPWARVLVHGERRED